MAAYFFCELDKPALDYRASEPMRFSVSLFEGDQSLPCKNIHWSWVSDGGESGVGDSCFDGKMPFLVEAFCSRPGFVHLSAYCCGEDGKEQTDGAHLEAGAGADVQQLRLHNELPADFFPFWNGIEQAVETTPAQVTEWEKLTTVYTPAGIFDLFRARLKTFEGNPVQLLVTMPTNEAKPILSLQMSFKGYSVVGADVTCVPGRIVGCINAHGIDDLQPGRYYQQDCAFLNGYGFHNDENASPETCYFRGMAIRNLTALQFLRTLQNWDGQHIDLVGGSQGALQATTVAAHAKGITGLSLGIPWLCDLFAVKQGYLRGWRPDPADGLRYFDTAAQAHLITCPVNINAGLGDYVCPPSSVMTLYNEFRCKKEITFMQNRTHPYIPPRADQFSLGYRL